MSLCAHCGDTTTDGSWICFHHIVSDDGFWAITNRVFCDFAHRRIVPPPVTIENVFDMKWVA